MRDAVTVAAHRQHLARDEHLADLIGWHTAVYVAAYFRGELPVDPPEAG